MKKHLLYLFPFVVLASFISFHESKAQTCSGEVANGQNLVTNHDFSEGYTHWTHDPAYVKFTPCGSSCYSVPGRIYVGDNSLDFNQAFRTTPGNLPIQDHSPSGDNMMLMVDGICNSGINLWSQSGIPLAPNTNYFFSIWVTSLSTTTPPGTLRFNINGTSLPTTITAPGVVGQWVKYTAVWNSGLTPPPTATISIQNTTTSGCETAVDFAVDDITFTPGCDYGSEGPMPNLGGDFTICGKTLPIVITPNFSGATSARNDITYTWYYNGVQQTSGMGPGFYSFNVNAPGTYSVCVDSAGSCPKTDIITVANDYSIELGPNLVLCSPTNASLDAGYTGPGVTYAWTRNGNPIPGASSRTYTVTTPGTYEVTVTDPACGVQSDNVTVTTTAAIPEDGTYCPVASGGTGSAALAVTGTGRYKWWDAYTGGNVVATGSNYVPAGLTGPGPHTFYVEDTSTFNLTVGPPIAGNGFTNVANMNPGDTKNLLVFNAVTGFRLDSLTVLPYNYYCSGSPLPNNVINFIILDASGATVGTSSYSAPCSGTGQPAAPMKVPVGIDIPAGNGYQLKLNTGSNAIALYLNTTGSGGNPPSPQLYQYPTVYSYAGEPVVEFVTNSAQDFDLYYSPNAYPGFFDWKITKGVSCDRVPVSAVLDCPDCVGSVAPTAVAVNTPSYCVATTTDITLTATGGSGDDLVWYSGSCGGTLVGTGTPLTIPAPSAANTYYARWETPGCNSSCLSVSVDPVSLPTVADAGTNSTLCNSSSTTLAANTPAVGTGIWTRISGSGTFANSSSPSTTVSGLGVGDAIFEWTISNAPCPASSSQVTIHRDTLTAPVLSSSGISWDTCANTSGITYSTTLDRSLNTVYHWSVTGTLNITSQSDNNVTLEVGTSGGTLQLMETFESCSLTVSRQITISAPISAPYAGLDAALCVDNATLNASIPASGTGVWTVSSGSATFADPNDPHSAISGLSNGTNVLTWTVNGCGGPLSDDVILTVGTSSLTIDLSGPSDTLCVGNIRELQAYVSGGSGQYIYSWTSKDNSFLQTTSDNSITINPTIPVMTYYIQATDLLNNGCSSNIDSAIVHTTITQELVIPNLITPNGDNKNDVLFVRDTDMRSVLPNSELEIVNRWGDTVYKNSNYDNTWQGDSLSDGIYYYNMKSGCGEKVYKGWIQVIR